MQIDDQPATVISLKTPYRSETWKQSVLRGQALNKTPIRLTKGRHRLSITALDHHIIADQWMIWQGGERQAYLIPVNTY